MRILEYRVKSQRLVPTGDHTGLVAGSSGYLVASFTFDSEWDSYTKVASFYKADGNEYAVKLDNNRCLIPTEALTGSTFEVGVWFGNDIHTIPTNRVKERQLGGDE